MSADAVRKGLQKRAVSLLFDAAGKLAADIVAAGSPDVGSAESDVRAPVTYGDLYRTPEERHRQFNLFCTSKAYRCSSCPCSRRHHVECVLSWLDLAVPCRAERKKGAGDDGLPEELDGQMDGDDIVGFRD